MYVDRIKGSLGSKLPSHGPVVMVTTVFTPSCQTHHQVVGKLQALLRLPPAPYSLVPTIYRQTNKTTTYYLVKEIQRTI